MPSAMLLGLCFPLLTQKPRSLNRRTQSVRWRLNLWQSHVLVRGTTQRRYKRPVNLILEQSFTQIISPRISAPPTRSILGPSSLPKAIAAAIRGRAQDMPCPNLPRQRLASQPASQPPAESGLSYQNEFAYLKSRNAVSKATRKNMM